MTALRAFIAIGIAGFWLLVIAPPMFQKPPSIYSGVRPLFTGALVQRNFARVERNSPGYRAGLRTGDVLGCLSVRDNYLLFYEAYAEQAAYRPGTVISTCVRREDGLHTVRFVAQTGPPLENVYRSNTRSAIRVFVFIIFLLTGIALVMARPSLMSWLFYLYCLGSAPTIASSAVWTVLPNWQYVFAAELPLVLNGLSVAFLLLFSILVPNENVPLGWRRGAFYIACIIGFAVLLFTAGNAFYTDAIFQLSVRNGMDEALTVITVLVVFARLATMERAERARFGWAAFAIIFGVIANDVRNVLSYSFVKEVQFIGTIAADLTIVMPLALMYAILKRHVIDVRFVISRTVVYAALTTVLVGVIGAVDWATSAYLNQVRVAMAIDAVVTIGLAFVLHRTYGWIERGVDYLLFRRKHDAETYLSRLAKTLLNAQHEETIDRALVHDPYDKLELTMAVLFRDAGTSFVLSCAAGWTAPDAPAFDRDHDLVRFLITERTRLHIKDLRRHVAAVFLDRGTAPAVAIPIFQGNDLTAFGVYGIHRDGTKLDPDEIETLERLCEMAAQAYIHIENLRYRALSARPLPT